MKKSLSAVAVFILAFAAMLSAQAQDNTQSVSVNGVVFLDKNEDGVRDSKEKGLAGVAVSDGFSVALTDKDGKYALELHPKARFVTVYTPSGYSNTNRFFTDVRSLVAGREVAAGSAHRGNKGFDFGLAKAQEYGSFAQMGDIEERCYGDWIDRLKDYSAVNDLDFIAITGDICYADGLINMPKYINEMTMQKRVVFTIGNHDLIKGSTDYLGNPYGEKNFEDNMGPSWYAFSTGGINFIVTPMMSGDAVPSYTLDDLQKWLEAYLAVLPAGAPLIIFNHDANANLIPKDANTRAYIYGHHHTHYHTQRDAYGEYVKGGAAGDGVIQFYCTMAPSKGSNDHAPSALRQFEYTADGITSSRLRYHPLRNHIVSHIAPVAGVERISAVVYDYAADVTKVTATFADGSKCNLQRRDDMMWQTDIPAKASGVVKTGDYYTVTAEFSDGERAVSRVTPEPELKWMNSIGSKPFFCTPLLSGGHIYIATIDNEMTGSCGIYSLSAADGSEEWFFKTLNSIHGDIALCDGVIYACDTDYNVYAVNAADGSLKWQQHTATTFYPSLTEGIHVDGGKVFVGTGRKLCALNAEDGSVAWTNIHSHGAITNIGTARTAAGALLTNGYWVGRFCYDQNSGEFLWENKEYQSKYSSCTPAVVDTTFVYAGYNSLVQVGARSGKILKYNEFETIFNVKSEPLVQDGKVFIGTSHDGVLAANFEDFSTAWTFLCKAPLIYTSPYTKNGEKTVECSPAAYGDKIIIGANDGYVYCLRQDNGKQVWCINIGLPVIGKPIISGDDLIIIDFAGNVYCYGLTPM